MWLFPHSDRALRFLENKRPKVTQLVTWQMQTQQCSQSVALKPPYGNTGEHTAAKGITRKHSVL